MARYESIRNDIWDEFEHDELSANARLLYLWSWSNPRCGMSGLYRVNKRTMLDSGIASESLDATLAELASHDYLYYEDHALWVKGRVKHLHNKSGTTARAIGKDVSQFPEGNSLRSKFIAAYGLEEWLKDTFDEFGLVAYPIDEASGGHNGASLSGAHTTDYRLLTSKEEGSGEKPSVVRSPLVAATLAELGRVAARHSIKPPSPDAVQRCIDDYPDVDPVGVAKDFAAWQIDGDGKPVKVIASSFRSQLRMAKERGAHKLAKSGDAGFFAAFDRVNGRAA